MVSTNPGFLSTWKLPSKRPHFQAHIPHKGQVPTGRKPEEISAFITNPAWLDDCQQPGSSRFISPGDHVVHLPNAMP